MGGMLFVGRVCARLLRLVIGVRWARIGGGAASGRAVAAGVLAAVPGSIVVACALSAVCGSAAAAGIIFAVPGVAARRGSFRRHDVEVNQVKLLTDADVGLQIYNTAFRRAPGGAAVAVRVRHVVNAQLAARRSLGRDGYLHRSGGGVADMIFRLIGAEPESLLLPVDGKIDRSQLHRGGSPGREGGDEQQSESQTENEAQAGNVGFHREPPWQ